MFKFKFCDWVWCPLILATMLTYNLLNTVEFFTLFYRHIIWVSGKRLRFCGLCDRNSSARRFSWCVYRIVVQNSVSIQYQKINCDSNYIIRTEFNLEILIGDSFWQFGNSILKLFFWVRLRNSKSIILFVLSLQL